MIVTNSLVKYFMTELKQTKLATKTNIGDFITKTYFDEKLKTINKKVKHLEAKEKLTDLSKKVSQVSGKGYYFLLGRTYFAGNDGYRNFLELSPMLDSLTLDNNNKKKKKNVTSRISARISLEKIKQFDSSLTPIMFNLGNGKIILKSNNSVLEQQNISSLYNNFILNSHNL